jgi:hypothetical protein
MSQKKSLSPKFKGAIVASDGSHLLSEISEYYPRLIAAFIKKQDKEKVQFD